MKLSPREIALQIANGERGDFEENSHVAHYNWVDAEMLADLIEEGIKEALLAEKPNTEKGKP